RNPGLPRLIPKWRVNGSGFLDCREACSPQIRDLTQIKARLAGFLFAAAYLQLRGLGGKLFIESVKVSRPAYPEVQMLAAPTGTFSRAVISFFAIVLLATVGYSVVGTAGDKDEEVVIAGSLAAMVNAALAVISKNQEHIDNPNLGDKGLDGKTVLGQAQDL